MQARGERIVEFAHTGFKVIETTSTGGCSVEKAGQIENKYKDGLSPDVV